MEKNPTWLPVVAAAIPDGEGRWLMYRRPACKQHGGLWEFPGGKLESEESPRLALVREIEEELGLTVDPAVMEPACFAETDARDGAQHIVIMLYTCQAWSGEPEAREGGAFDWFTPAGIAALPKPPLDIELAAQLFDLDTA